MKTETCIMCLHSFFLNSQIVLLNRLKNRSRKHETKGIDTLQPIHIIKA